MSMKYGTGKDKLVGQSIIYSFPISLDAAQYEGAVIVADDGQLYFSDGADWKIPNEEVDIARPSALTPTNAIEQTQLRLSNFRSPAGFTQTGIFFEVSYANNFATPDFTRTVTSTTASMYQTLYPEDGVQPGDVFWWRARYLGNDGTQSEFSLPFQQTYPELIDNPVPVTREGATTGFLQLSPYVSAFGLNYVNTEVEIYASDGITLVTAFTSLVGASVPVPSGVIEGQAYVWRARYNGRTGTTGPVLATEWTPKRTFFNGAKSMVLVYDPVLMAARTINIVLLGTVNVTVNWGDGTTNTYTTAGYKAKTYAAGVTGLVTVTISGQLTQFGPGLDNYTNPGLVRVDTIGFGLGLTSLFGAFKNANNLASFTAFLPPQVTDCRYMFAGSNFAANISTLDVSNVRDFTGMFDNCGNNVFSNSDLTGWNTSSATNMSYMFARNLADTGGFNQAIGGWDVSKVTNFQAMFAGTSLGAFQNFNQNLGAWNTSSAINMQSMFGHTGAGGGTGRSLFNNGGSATINNWNVSNVTNMRGMFGTDYTEYGPTRSFNQPIGAWNVSKVTDMSHMFGFNPAFNQPLSTWNTVAVTTMLGMFCGASTFNQSLNGWNTGAVTNMGYMFRSTAAFNGTIDAFNTANVTNMLFMFNGANVFNRPLDTWNVSKVTTMYGMFFYAVAFNQPLNSWNTGAVTNMGGMFERATAFNNSIGNWNVSSVTNMASTFAYSGFNQPIGSWNVSSVTTMFFMFLGALSFNQNISSWNVSNVANMQSMFNQAAAFNQPIGNWDVSKVTAMSGLFFAATAFNQDIGAWNLNNNNVTILDFGLNGMNAENYSRMLVGWANRLALDDGPYTITMSVSATRQYNSTVYAAGSRFETAVQARAFLVGSRVVSVTGASDANANTTYAYNATTLTYDASNGWKFAILGTSWALYNASAVLQATGTGATPGTGPHTATAWTGVLSAATVLRTGAGWTITGDAAV